MIDRLLIVGSGSIGQRHARLSQEALPGATIAMVRRPTSSAPIDAPVAKTFASVADAISFAPQAAVIAGPATHHVDAATTLAKAGAHLLVEKPISHTADRVGELIHVCRSRGRVLMVGYNLRFLPALRRFRDLILEGRVGRVLSVRAEVGQYLPTWRPSSDYRQTVSARSDLGGGVLLELSHEIDYLRWLFGDVAWVSATTSRQSDLEIDVEDTAHLVFGFAPAAGRGVIGSLSLDFIRHDRSRSCVVIGDRGSLRWDAMAGRVEWFAAGSSAWTTEFEHVSGRDDSYRAEWSEFLRCIESAADPLVTGEDALATIRVVDAARESARTGCRVTLGGTS